MNKNTLHKSITASESRMFWHFCVKKEKKKASFYNLMCVGSLITKLYIYLTSIQSLQTRQIYFSKCFKSHINIINDNMKKKVSITFNLLIKYFLFLFNKCSGKNIFPDFLTLQVPVFVERKRHYAVEQVQHKMKHSTYRSNADLQRAFSTKAQFVLHMNKNNEGLIKAHRTYMSACTFSTTVPQRDYRKAHIQEHSKQVTVLILVHFLDHVQEINATIQI